MGLNVEHIWTVLCKTTAIDQQTNNISLFNVVEELRIEVETHDRHAAHPTLSKDLVIPAEMALVSLWKRINANAAAAYAGVICLKSPTGVILSEDAFEVRFNSSQKRLRTILNFRGIKVAEPGEHIFEVCLKLNRHASPEPVVKIPLDVKIVRR